MRIRFTIALLVLLIGFSPGLFAQYQEAKFEHFTVVEGLPENSAWAILQDHLGFMWFGTQNGLVKYDGYTYQIFKPDPENPNSLSDRRIYEIHEDGQGDLWIGTVWGLNHFDRDTERFTTYVPDPSDPNSLSGGTIFSIHEDSNGHLWIGTLGDGLNRLEPETGTITRYRANTNDPAALQDNQIHGMWEDGEGYLWFGTHAGGLHRFDALEQTFISFQHDPTNPFSISSNDVNAVFEDEEGVMWLATANGLNRFDRETETFTRYQYDPDDPTSLAHNNVMSVVEDRDGVLWVGLDGNDVFGGLNRFDRETGTFTRYMVNPDNPTSISSNAVLTVFEDRQGALWVGTGGGGINKLDFSAQKFTHYQHDSNNPDGLGAREVAALHEGQDGTLWVGTWGGGLNRFDRETGTFAHYRHDPANTNTPSGDHILTIHENDAGELWLGGWAGVDHFDPDTETFTHYHHDPDDPNSLSSNAVTAIYQDEMDMVWIGTWNSGINRLDIHTGSITRYEHMPGIPGTLPDNTVRAILGDADGLWVIARSGMLSKYNRALDQFILDGAMAIETLLPSEVVQGRLWVGTSIEGLRAFDMNSGVADAYTEADGLLHDTVLGLLEDDEGGGWAATARGLSHLDPETGAFKNYDSGIRANKIGYIATAKGRDGQLYFGGHDGFIAFHPDQIQENTYVPPVVLTDFKLFTESVAVGSEEESPLGQHISVTKEVRLKHWQNDLSFTFSALNYQHPEKNRYAFKLDNYDEAYRDAGDARTATYTNLAPGTYRFHARGSNNDEVWNEEGTAIRLVIAPPWWKTTWAYALFLLLGGASVFGVIRWRVHYLEKRASELEAIVSERTAEIAQQKATIEAQAQRLQELDRMKSRFFANISHEFRTPLSLILGPLQDALDGMYGTLNDAFQKQIRVMQRSGYRLLRLINQLLDLSKLESGNMRLQACKRNLIPFLKGVVLSFSSMAERKHITFKLDAEDDSFSLYFDQDKLEKVFYNLLSNAFKFTPEQGEIRVTVRRVMEGEEDWVTIQVRDTGAGISAKELPYIFDRFHQVEDSTKRESEGTGIGLALVRELVMLHGGTITVQSTVNVGTIFSVRLPMNDAHLNPGDIVEEFAVPAQGDGAYREVSFEVGGEPENDVEQETKVQPPTPGNAPVVLLVEDHADVRDYIASRLAGHYQVVEAEHGAEGLEKVRTLKPDLIISDVMMPVMNGYEFCRVVKKDPELNHIPVILLTAKAGEESKVEGLETGADDYIFKPFSADELLARAENLIGIRRQLRRRFSREVVAVEPSEITITSADQVFLDRVQGIVEEHLANSNFGASWLADEVGLSERQLRRKLKDLTNLSTAGYIRSLRLQRAAQLLEERAGNVSEVAYAVGFQDPKHFSKLFRQVFGVSPSQFHPVRK